MPLIVSMLKTTVFQSIAISLVGMPSMAILPPWHMLASMSRKASGCAGHLEPDVEAFLHAQLFLHSGSEVSRGFTARVTPILRASSSRYGFTSVITT